MSDPDRLAAIKRRLSAIPPNDIRDAIDRELFAEVDRLRGLPSLCRCSHIKDAHYARKPGGYDLCQAPGCFCVEYLP